jgi:hypothetical protein
MAKAPQRSSDYTSDPYIAEASRIFGKSTSQVSQREVNATRRAFVVFARKGGRTQERDKLARELAKQ